MDQLYKLLVLVAKPRACLLVLPELGHANWVESNWKMTFEGEVTCKPETSEGGDPLTSRATERLREGQCGPGTTLWELTFSKISAQLYHAFETLLGREMQVGTGRRISRPR